MYSEITFIGNLGRDPEMEYLPSGQAVTKFSVASNYSYTPKGGEKITITTWFKVSVWGKQAEIMNQYLSLGSKVFVKGRLNPDKETGSPRIWLDKDGEPRTSYEVTANNIVFLDNPKQVVEDDDVPF